MTKQFRSLLDELYEIDPDLKAREKELIPIIKLLMEHNPGREPDPAFVQELRSRLRDRAATLMESHAVSPSLWFTRFASALTGAIATIVIAGPAVYVAMRGEEPSVPTNATSELFSYQVEDAAPRAFGTFDSLSPAGGGFGGRGGGGGGTEAMGGDTAISNEDAKMIAPDMMPPYGFTQYTYVYDGELPELPANVDVLRRDTSAGLPLSAIGSLNLGSINLGSFPGMTVDSLSFIQDREYGYMIGLQLREGSVSISQNWQKWPHPESECRDEACYQRYRVKLSEIPADDELIRIANAFAEEHGIDLSNYGPPEVDNMWKNEYDRVADKSMAYIPEVMRVVYPVLVEGKPVYTEGGTKDGIGIGVSIRHKRVNDMWGMTTQRYERSSYAGVTPDAVKAYIANFEQMPVDILRDDAAGDRKTVTVRLGTPTIGNVRMYSYEANRTDDLVVPALIFPIEQTEGQDMLWRQSITVPLSKDMLDKLSERSNPMPL